MHNKTFIFIIPKLAHCSTDILQVSIHVLSKYSLAAIACSSVLNPIKANRLNLPSFVYFNCTSVIKPF